MKATDTALLGHLEEEGTLYLSAVAVADLWTSSTGVFIQGRVLGTFVGQAVGAGAPEMAGVWLQVSLACLAPLAVIPLILWSTLTSTVISLITTDTSLIAPGALYAGVLASALPGRVLFSQLSQYLTARHVMHPTTISAAAALLTNLGLGLFFILGLPHISGGQNYLEYFYNLICTKGFHIDTGFLLQLQLPLPLNMFSFWYFYCLGLSLINSNRIYNFPSLDLQLDITSEELGQKKAGQCQT